jgi:hypothetical protein
MGSESNGHERAPLAIVTYETYEQDGTEDEYDDVDVIESDSVTAIRELTAEVRKVRELLETAVPNIGKGPLGKLLGLR